MPLRLERFHNTRTPETENFIGKSFSEMRTIMLTDLLYSSSINSKNLEIALKAGVPVEELAQKAKHADLRVLALGEYEVALLFAEYDQQAIGTDFLDAQGTGIDIKNNRHRLLLLTLIRHGAAEWVFQKVLQALDLKVREHRDLIRALVQNGQAEPVLTRCSIEQLRPTELADSDLLCDFIVAGYGDAVRVVCESELHSLENTAYVKVVKKMIEYGQAEWVKTRHFADPKTIGPLTTVRAELLADLARGGQQAVVKEYFEPTTFSESNTQHLHILSALLEAGEIDWVRSRCEHFSLDIQNPRQKMFCTILARYGLQDLLPPIEKAPTELPTVFDDAETTERLLLERDQKQRLDLLQRMNQLFEQLPPSDTVVQYQKKLRLVIEHFPAEGLWFLTIALRRYGALSNYITTALDRIDAGQSFFVPITKRFSIHGTLIGGSIAFDFINTIPQASATAWEKAGQLNIPVAPINGPIKPHGEDVRVRSMYCGTSLETIEHVAPKLYAYCMEQRLVILEQLIHAGIVHGDDHHGNFTVEFVRQSFMNINSGIGINEIPRNTDVIMFDIIKYIQNPEEWRPVVRLIDWEMSNF